MSHFNLRSLLIVLTLLMVPLHALAQSSDEHKNHHPAEIKPSATSTKKAPVQSMNMDDMKAMDQHIKTMQAMHEKMLAAKSPEERQALMADHMKMMQDGMDMMKGMRDMGGMRDGKKMGDGMSERHAMMEKKMEMMQAMMQMMMDRMSSMSIK